MALIEPNRAITKIIHLYLLTPGKRSSLLKKALDEYIVHKDIGALIESLDLAKQVKSDHSVYSGHTLFCWHDQYIYDSSVKIWEAAWPHHCAFCKGQGVHVEINYPLSPDEIGPCECTDYEADKVPHCPRCGVEWPNEAIDDIGELIYNRVAAEQLSCPSCKWNWCKEKKTDIINQDMLPDWPGCNCDSLEETK